MNEEPSLKKPSPEEIESRRVESENKEREALLAKSQEAVTNLLAALSITRVVYVDNLFGPDIERILEAVTASLSDGLVESVQKLFPELDLDSVPDTSTWQTDLRTRWDNGTPPEREYMFEAANKLPNQPEPEDTVGAAVLRSVMPDGFDYITVTPQEWVAKGPTWLKEATSTQRLLCLFDVGLSVEIGGIKLTKDGGKHLLSQAVQDVQASSASYDGRVLFGLYSHYYRIGEEPRKLKDFSDELGIPTSVFLPLSKERNEPLTLSDGIQLLVLNQHADKLKQQIKSVMSVAQRKTIEDLDGLDVYTFEQAVLESSLKEGVWEAETLIRLFSLLQGHYGRLEIGEQTAAAAFNENVQLVRKIIPRLGRGEQGSVDSIRKIRRIELYLEGEELNSFHFPLRSGDIFADDNQNEYILLAQPCDLMVRSNGSRSVHMRSVDVFKITKTLPPSKVAGQYGKLEHFDGAKPAFIPFKERIAIPLDVLDLCVLNPEGRCNLNLSNLPKEPAQFHPAWAGRHNKLVQIYKEAAPALDTLQSLIEQSKEDTQRATLELIRADRLKSNGALPTVPTYEAQVFNFGLRRKAHYRAPLADYVLAEYTHFLGRTAEEHNYAQTA